MEKIENLWLTKFFFYIKVVNEKFVQWIGFTIFMIISFLSNAQFINVREIHRQHELPPLSIYHLGARKWATKIGIQWKLYVQSLK